jgi:hypothetical protein
MTVPAIIRDDDLTFPDTIMPLCVAPCRGRKKGWVNMQSLATSRFVLQSFLDELDEFDRDIPVARNIQVGDIADAIQHLLRLTDLSFRTSDHRIAILQAEPS